MSASDTGLAVLDKPVDNDTITDQPVDNDTAPAPKGKGKGKGKAKSQDPEQPQVIVQPGFKFDAIQERLVEALGVVGQTISQKSTLPILTNVLLTVDGESLTLTGTNLNVFIAHRIAATVERGGGFTLPAKILADYTALLDKGEKVSFELAPKEARVDLACGRYKAQVQGLAAPDFPPVPERAETAIGFDIPAATLRKALRQVLFSVAPDDTRPVLAGVLMRVEGEALTLAAADGFKLAVRQLDLLNTPPLSAIVHSDMLKIIDKLLPDSDLSVSVSVWGSFARFAFGDTVVVGRVIEGDYPKYEKIIPKEKAGVAMTMATSDALRATRAAAVFARDNSNIVRLVGKPAKGDDELGEVTITSTSAENGGTEGAIDAVVDGEVERVAFNGTYLREILAAIDTPNFVLRVTGPAQPGLFKPAATTEKVLYVLMPMHDPKPEPATNGHSTEDVPEPADDDAENEEDEGEGTDE